jgi:putative transposase
MTIKRQPRSAGFKAKVAIEAIKSQRTTNQIALDFGVHPSQVSKWKKRALETLPSSFDRAAPTHNSDHHERQMATLYEQIGRLKVELDWLKKKSGFGR